MAQDKFKKIDDLKKLVGKLPKTPGCYLFLVVQEKFFMWEKQRTLGPEYQAISTQIIKIHQKQNILWKKLLILNLS